MRWHKPKLPRDAEVGETRNVTKFLWWPMAIGAETRWLELATWVEKVVEYELFYGLRQWRKVEWWSGQGFPKPGPFPERKGISQPTEFPDKPPDKPPAETTP